MRSARMMLAGGIAGLLAVQLSAEKASTPSPRTPDPESRLQKVLQAESAGESVDRTRLLFTILQDAPDVKSVRWQSGQVQHDGEWVDFTEVPLIVGNQKSVQEYRDRRAKAGLTFRDQKQLADWCRANGLPERERAHLTAAMEASGNFNDPALRNRLGFRLVDGRWITQAELDARKSQGVDDRRNFAQWRSKITRLTVALNSRNPATRKAAERELRAISHPNAIPALEAVLLKARGSRPAPLERWKLHVEILHGVPSNRAADALARVAVLSPWDVVRKQAAKALQTRPIEAFAPKLLASLQTEVDSRLGLFVGGGGVHLLQLAGTESQRTHKLLAQRSSTIIVPTGGGSNSPTAAERGRRKIARATENAAISAELQARAAERNVDRLNDAQQQWNNRICSVLADATGVRLGNDPRDWWEWWSDYNEMPRTGEEDYEKEYECYYYYETRVEEVDLSEPEILPAGDVQPAPTQPNRPECLVAGTPVWTDRGFVPVEQVHVGDLVLSKNPDTGELRYSPVLRTTSRGEKPVMKLVVGNSTIRATGGHTFWISGRGWMKLKQARPGQQLHTALGSAAVKQLEPDGKAKTYNLVIDGDHSYFVGKEMVLSHDVTFGQPTDAVVPGLQPDYAHRRSPRQ